MIVVSGARRVGFEAFLPATDPAADPSPRCVLVIGDGFSKDLRRHLGFDELFNTRWPFPAPADCSHRVSIGEPLVESVVQGIGEFDTLFNRVEEFGANHHRPGNPTFHDFCARCIPEPNETKSELDRSAFLPPDRLCRETRRYLWRLFRWQHDMFLDSLTPARLWQWPWTPTLQHLARFTRLTLISFNYDFLAEFVLSRIHSVRLLHPAEYCSRAYLNRPENRIVVLKPHGCIFRATLSEFGNGCEDCPVVWTDSDGFAHFDPDLRVCPMIPDLVPPGHSRRSRSNPNTDVDAAIALALSEADSLICCGFSGAPPDDTEFRSHIKSLRPNAYSIHVGLTEFGDFDNDAARVIREFAHTYRFLNAGWNGTGLGVEQLPEILGARGLA